MSKKPNELEKITQLQFEERMLDEIQETKEYYNSLLKGFERYVFDKENYRLEYFKKDDIVTYQKFQKNPIGFHNG